MEAVEIMVFFSREGEQRLPHFKLSLQALTNLALHCIFKGALSPKLNLALCYILQPALFAGMD